MPGLLGSEETPQHAKAHGRNSVSCCNRSCSYLLRGLAAHLGLFCHRHGPAVLLHIETIKIVRANTNIQTAPAASIGQIGPDRLRLRLSTRCMVRRILERGLGRSVLGDHLLFPKGALCCRAYAWKWLQELDARLTLGPPYHPARPCWAPCGAQLERKLIRKVVCQLNQLCASIG